MAWPYQRTVQSVESLAMAVVSCLHACHNACCLSCSKKNQSECPGYSSEISNELEPPLMECLNINYDLFANDLKLTMSTFS